MSIYTYTRFFLIPCDSSTSLAKRAVALLFLYCTQLQLQQQLCTEEFLGSKMRHDWKSSYFNHCTF